MTDAEIVEFIKTKPANACGRFRHSQLKDYAITRSFDLPIKPSGMLLRAGLISLFLALINKPATAQIVKQSIKTEQTLAEKLKPSKDGKRVISGVVTDNDSIPMPGVNVVLAGSAVGTVTDASGRFQFPQPVEDGQVLIFSFIGYITYTHYVGFSTSDFLQVKLNSDAISLGNMRLVMMGEVLTHKAPRQNLFATIKRWFH